tara:strand:- start:6760 stop:7524 length:765 start_codon:yes stop_codon:yes gene_type:complete
MSRHPTHDEQVRRDQREIQENQIRGFESKLRFIVENAEQMIVQMRIKQGEELSKFATSKDKYSLWRGSDIEHYVFGNLMNEEYSEIRRDMNARLNPQVEETELFDFEETAEDLENEFIEELEQEAEEIEEAPSFKHEGTVHADQLTTDMITLVKLTDMEKRVMSKLVDEGLWYNWGSEPSFSDVTPQELSKATGIEGRKLRGVLSSLTKKDLLYVEDMSDWGRKNFKIVYPLYPTYVAYEANTETVKICYGETV